MTRSSQRAFASRILPMISLVFMRFGLIWLISSRLLPRASVSAPRCLNHMLAMENRSKSRESRNNECQCRLNASFQSRVDNLNQKISKSKKQQHQGRPRTPTDTHGHPRIRPRTPTDTHGHPRIPHGQKHTKAGFQKQSLFRVRKLRKPMVLNDLSREWVDFY